MRSEVEEAELCEDKVQDLLTASLRPGRPDLPAQVRSAGHCRLLGQEEGNIGNDYGSSLSCFMTSEVGIGVSV